MLHSEGCNCAASESVVDSYFGGVVVEAADNPSVQTKHCAFSFVSPLFQ